MNERVKRSLIIGAVIFAIFMIVGCTKSVEDRINSISNQLPVGATNITVVGNGWYTFEVMSGDAAGCYLIKSRSAGGHGYMTQRPCG